jgi:hypothetical protein
MLSEQVQAILSKPGSFWTPEEKNIITDMVKNGQRAELKKIREQLRG